MNNFKKNIVLVYLGFFINGFFVLSVGAIIPDLIKKLNLSFSEAGLILSLFALGNLLANFIFPFLSDKFGIKKSIFSIGVSISMAFLLIVTMGSLLGNNISFLFLFMGIGRGSVSIVSNMVINDLSINKTKSINLLHTVWALGAFLSAFVLISLKNIGFNFDQIMLFLVMITAIMAIVFVSVDYDYDIVSDNVSVVSAKVKDTYFYVIAIFLFFYLGLEYTVNGWLMTYLQNTGIISESLSGVILSLTWLMIMAGRIFTAYISDKVKGSNIVMIYVVGISIMVLSLLFAKNQWVVFFTMMILGFFLSAIYPTTISNVSEYVVGDQKNMAILLTSGAIGGMITPQIIGVVADKTNMMFAMNTIGVNVIFMFVFAYISLKMKKKQN